MNSAVADMQAIHIEMDVTKFQAFWDAATAILEDKNGSGTHRRQHAESELETATDVFYAPGIVSIPQISPNNKFKETVHRYTGHLPFKLKLQSCDAHDYSHPAFHYVSAMKRVWRGDLLHVFFLIKGHINSYDDGMPCLIPLQ
eukprot:1750195-Ditylum_brightwellii.AAC.1